MVCPIDCTFGYLVLTCALVNGVRWKENDRSREWGGQGRREGRRIGMNRAEAERYIRETYRTEPDFPWRTHPHFAVFRHGGNRKWFALLLEVPKKKLGLPGDGALDVLNVKCDPVLLGSLLGERGFFPAYHMNKTNWITVALDGTAADEIIRVLLDRSHAATAPGRTGP